MKKYLTAFNDAGSFVFTGGLDGADLGAAHPAVEEALGLAEASADLTALEAVPRIRWCAPGRMASASATPTRSGTAQNRVQHIWTKLDLPNRSRVAVWGAGTGNE